jgi:hypothetical protein
VDPDTARQDAAQPTKPRVVVANGEPMAGHLQRTQPRFLRSGGLTIPGSLIFIPALCDPSEPFSKKQSQPFFIVSFLKT